MALYPESNKEVNKNYIPPASTRRRDLIDRGQINYTWWELPNGKFSDGVTLQSVIHAMPTVNAIVLPCNIGDTVWTILYDKIYKAKVICVRPFVFKDYVEFRGNVEITYEDPFYSDGRPYTQELFVVFGKDTFLTEEEAQMVFTKIEEN